MPPQTAPHASVEGERLLPGRSIGLEIAPWSAVQRAHDAVTLNSYLSVLAAPRNGPLDAARAASPGSLTIRIKIRRAHRRRFAGGSGQVRFGYVGLRG